MNRKQRREISRKIRQAYRITRTVETLPMRYREMVLEKIVRGKDWNKMQENCYYSERQMRNILNEALDEVGRRLSEGENP